MKYFKYWIEDKQRITIAGQSEEIRLLVGSNVSKEDALNEALLKAKKIEQRIANREPREEYEANIKEHIAKIIDDSNVVSVCRYGANILNTTEYTVLDLDDYNRSFWDMFTSIRKMSKKEKIVAKFESFIGKYPELGSDFRVYETSKGVRVIGKKYMDPTNQKNIRLMHKLKVDWLYMILSSKQKCYRARLTPKPYRLKIKTIKVSSPLVCETDAYKNWAKMYQSASRDYSVVRLIKSIGKDFAMDQVIRLHDEQCNALQGLKLA